MMQFKSYVSAILALLFLNSCGEKKYWQKDTDWGDEPARVTKQSSDSLPGLQHQNLYLPGLILVNGGRVSITFSSYGCFHYEYTTINIIKHDDTFETNLIVSDGNSKSANVTHASFDKSFEKTLKHFAVVFQSQMRKQLETRSTNPAPKVIGTTYRVILNDGLHDYSFFAESWSEYEYLKRILMPERNLKSKMFQDLGIVTNK